MKYKKYPSYKDSGVEWLGEIPKNWTHKKIKYIATTIPGGTPSTTNIDYWEGDVPWLPSGAVQNCLVYPYNVKKYITKEGLNNSAAKYIKPNSVLIALTGATCSNIGYLTFKSTANQSVVGIETNKNTDDKYLYYSLISQRNQILVQRTGGAQSGINDQNVKDLFFPYPYLRKEQQQIANFLDNGTAKIDTLIEKQTKLCELLKEKRQALISHAVTKGINSDVKMKDSGVEWLGDIPEHWGIHKLKYAVRKIGDIDHDMPKSISSGKPYLMTGDIVEKASLIDFSDTKQISEEDYLRLSRKIKPNKGDIIFARYATIGTVCYVDIEKDFLVSYSCVTIKTIPKKVFGEYLIYFFKSNFFFNEIKNYINSNTQGNVGIDSLYKSTLIIPNLDEQRQILSYLDDKTSKIDKLIEKANRSITLLKEKRTALIGAAVTGKIDVRELV